MSSVYFGNLGFLFIFNKPQGTPRPQRDIKDLVIKTP